MRITIKLFALLSALALGAAPCLSTAHADGGTRGARDAGVSTGSDPSMPRNTSGRAGRDGGTNRRNTGGTRGTGTGGTGTGGTGTGGTGTGGTGGTGTGGTGGTGTGGTGTGGTTPR